MTDYAGQSKRRILGGTTARRGDVVIIARRRLLAVRRRAATAISTSASAQGVAMLGHCHPGVTAAIAATGAKR